MKLRWFRKRPAICLVLSLATALFIRTFYVEFMYIDVHQIQYPYHRNRLGWKRQTFFMVEDAFQSVMMNFDFKGDDCKGCLRTDYKEILEPSHICRSKGNNGVTQPNMLLLIFTTFGNQKAREAVRQTWLSKSVNNTGGIKHVFLIGKGTTSKQQVDLRSENDRFADILQHDYVESVRNMTLKIISALRWVAKNCPEVPHVMKVDSDIWLNIPRWKSLLSGQLIGGKYLQDAMIGHCRLQPSVIRFPLHRYFISSDAYAELRHPSYCRGPSYYLSRKLVKAVVNVSYTQPFIPVEDAYVGHCLHTLGYGVFNPPDLVMNDLRLLQSKMEEDPCEVLEVAYTIHDVSPEELVQLWKQNLACHSRL